MDYKIILYWSKNDLSSREIAKTLRYRTNKQAIKCISLETIRKYRANVPSYVKEIPCITIKSIRDNELNVLHGVRDVNNFLNHRFPINSFIGRDENRNGVFPREKPRHNPSNHRTNPRMPIGQAGPSAMGQEDRINHMVATGHSGGSTTSLIRNPLGKGISNKGNFASEVRGMIGFERTADGNRPIITDPAIKE